MLRVSPLPPFFPFARALFFFSPRIHKLILRGAMRCRFDTQIPLSSNVGISTVAGLVSGIDVIASRFDSETGATLETGARILKPSQVGRPLALTGVNSGSGNLYAGSLLGNNAVLYTVDPTDLSVAAATINAISFSGGLSGKEGIFGVLGANDEYLVWAARSYGHHLGLLARDPATGAISLIAKFKLPIAEADFGQSYQFRLPDGPVDDGKAVFFSVGNTGTYVMYKVDKVAPTLAEMQAYQQGTIGAGPVIRVLDHETIVTRTEIVKIDRATLTVVSRTPLTGSFQIFGNPLSTMGERGLEPTTLPIRTATTKSGKSRYSYVDVDGTVTTFALTGTLVDAVGDMIRPDFANGGVYKAIQSDCCSSVTSLSTCLQVPECGFCRKHTLGDTSSTAPPYAVTCLDGDASGPATPDTCLSWHYSTTDNSYTYVDPADGSSCTKYFAI